jgi:hypothetical protein
LFIALNRDVIAIIEHKMETIKEIDRVREIIARRIPIVIDFDLWHHSRADQRLRTERDSLSCSSGMIENRGFGSDSLRHYPNSGILPELNSHLSSEVG